ncbi:MAG: hypothetical protein R3C11_21970 [Planctomycetaceae bacterium]
MDPTGTKKMNNNANELQKQLSELFGTYRAEWLQNEVFELFTKPEYFPELETRQSCVLIGGRGTGKTTVLKGLSYEGQHALSKHFNSTDFRSLPFIGLYHRINTNHVSAFKGIELQSGSNGQVYLHITLIYWSVN